MPNPRISPRQQKFMKHPEQCMASKEKKLKSQSLHPNTPQLVDFAKNKLFSCSFGNYSFHKASAVSKLADIKEKKEKSENLKLFEEEFDQELPPKP